MKLGYLQTDLDQARGRLGAPDRADRRRCSPRFRPSTQPAYSAPRSANASALQPRRSQNRLRSADRGLARQLGSAGDAQHARTPQGRRRRYVSNIDVIDEIKRLNPKSGLKFGSVQVQPVVPDAVFVRQAADGNGSSSWYSDTSSPRPREPQPLAPRSTTRRGTVKDKTYRP